MNYKTITEDIVKYFKDNLGSYLSSQQITAAPSSYTDGDIDVLTTQEISFVTTFNDIEIIELTNDTNLMKIVANIFVLFKVRDKNSTVIDLVRSYFDNIYEFIMINNTLGNAVDKTKVLRASFLESDETSKLNTKLLQIDLEFYKEI